MTYEVKIEELRKEINRLNAEIVEKLAERVKVAQEIGRLKIVFGRPIVDRDREKRVYEQVRELACLYHLCPKGVEQVFREIIRLCTEAEFKSNK
jgi:chorismate mutase